MLAIVLATAIFGWVAVSVVAVIKGNFLMVLKDYSPAFERTSPGVLIIVELKKTSNLLLAEGVKPDGVTLCACARPARPATRSDGAMNMVRILRREEQFLDANNSI